MFATVCRFVASDKKAVETDAENEIVLDETSTRKWPLKQQHSKNGKMQCSTSRDSPPPSNDVCDTVLPLLEHYHCGTCDDKLSSSSSQVSPQQELFGAASNDDSHYRVTNDRTVCSRLSQALTERDEVPELSNKHKRMQYSCDTLWYTSDMSLISDHSSCERTVWPFTDVLKQPCAEKASHTREVNLCELCGIVFLSF